MEQETLGAAADYQLKKLRWEVERKMKQESLRVAAGRMKDWAGVPTWQLVPVDSVRPSCTRWAGEGAALHHFREAVSIPFWRDGWKQLSGATS